MQHKSQDESQSSWAAYKKNQTRKSGITLFVGGFFFIGALLLFFLGIYIILQ